MIQNQEMDFVPWDQNHQNERHVINYALCYDFYNFD